MALGVPDIMTFKPHHMHGVDRSWPETNCYVDLWIEVLASLGRTPEACFGFAVTQDFGADQFDFSKPPLPDLELFYGLKVRELSLYRSLEHHVALHVQQGSIVLLEVDAFYLPDTLATSYRQGHSKTTIAINYVNRDLQQCYYFHNATYGKLLGKDYVGIFRMESDADRADGVMLPYVEVVEHLTSWIPHDNLQGVATKVLQRHFMQRPQQNPFAVWRQNFDQHLDFLFSNPTCFHDYAFHFPRMAGSNFEALSSHIKWLAEEQLEQAVQGCQNIAAVTKTLQYRLARSVTRKKIDLADDCFDLLEQSYLKMIAALDNYLS